MFKTIAFAGVLMGLGLGGLKVCPGVVLLFEPGMTIRNPRICSMRQAVLGVKTKLDQQKVMEEILAESKVVASDKGLDLWQTPDGSFWIRQGPDTLLPTLLAQQRRNIYGEGAWGVHAGDVVLDCGAHVGVFTRKALASGAKLVVAIEPAPAAVECLRRNFKNEIEAGKVIVYPKGVWDKEETLEFFTDNNADAGDSFVQSVHKSGVEKIPVTTIDKLVKELHISNVDFIKADIKGALVRALRGGKEVLQKDQPRLAFSTEEAVDNPEEVRRTVLSLVPQYQSQCGPCLLDQKEVYLDVLMFRL